MSIPPILVIAVTAGVTAVVICLVGMVVWRRRRKSTDRVMRDAAVDLATVADRDAIATAIGQALDSLIPRRIPHKIEFTEPGEVAVVTDQTMGGTRLVPVNAVRSDGDAEVGVLLVDPETAADPHLRVALEAISAQAALAVDRIRLTEEIARHGGSDYLNALVEQTSDVILILDEDNRIRYASPSAHTVFGTLALDGTPLTELVDRAEQRPAEFLLRHVRASDASSRTGTGRADWTIRARDGRKVRVEVSCRALRTEDPVVAVVVTLRDVSTQRHLEYELTRRMFHDPLTGLANRRSFSERVGQAIATETALTGVIFIDIDNFKATNDALGHEAGDAVLTAIGHRIRDASGRDGVVARLGDDEFAVLIRNITERAAAEAAAHIAGVLAAPIPLGEDDVWCSASVGVATSAGTSSVQELLQRADLAMSAAKATGHGQVREYDPSMTSAFTDRVSLRAALGHAIHDDSLTVEYQPIVALDTGRTVGCEALLRWHHPTRGLVHPGSFIDIAEESGLIVPLGEWTLETAMNAAQRWGAAIPRDPPYVSVNVSVQQFRSAGFGDTVGRLLAATGLPPHRLVLEITESLLLRDDDRVWEDLRHLRQLGVRIAIDDFGTGYSSLSYLRHAPVDIVKLDRLFITPLASSARQRELVAGIVRLTATLNLEVVAEGIETDQQRDIAASIGCAYGQGYLFARPMPDIEAYLSQPYSGVGRS